MGLFLEDFRAIGEWLTLRSGMGEGDRHNKPRQKTRRKGLAIAPITEFEGRSLLMTNLGN
ncbi:MAG: hypothetical protein AAF889_09720 [Cyanobacteria bacterium P01_D01_bin.73]